MVVKEDGTKWACQSCLKGHRVSGCHHTDRELILVPKKGRPVTQCQHCRLERKKRSAHVRCDCGEPDKPHHAKEKCVHLREAEDRAKVGFHDDQSTDRDTSHLVAVAEEQGCCCHHGGKCSCALLRKEQDGLSDSTLPHGPAVQKPRLETTRSDGSITVFANGHHKPVHRKNHAAHECGMPYKMPMPRAHTDQNTATVARRSVDSLILDTRTRPAHLTSTATSSSTSERDFSISAQHSPKIVPAVCGGLGNFKLSTLDFSSLGPTRTNRSIDSAASDAMAFSTVDPASATADSSYDPWSALPSTEANVFPDDNPFGPWATNFEGGNVAQPALTAASSGTQSEVDEIPLIDDLYGFPMPSIQEDEGPLSLDVDMGEGSNLNRRSLPPNFFGNADFNMPPPDNEWPASIGAGTPNDGKKAVTGNQLFDITQWSAPNMPIMNAGQRSMSNIAGMGPPQGQAVGPSSAPNEDIIKQLFPEFDLNGGFSQNDGTSGPPSPAAWKRMAGLPTTATSSEPVDFAGLDDEAGFTSQAWTDGSVSVPHDAFTTPFDLNQDYPTPDFSAWQQ